jgi:hypothetical protein
MDLNDDESNGDGNARESRDPDSLRATSGFTRDRQTGLWLVGVFIASRIAAYAAGVRFDGLPITFYWQYLDLELLRTELLRSLFFQHSQPPLFNLLLGIVTKVAPGGEGVLLAVLYRGLGLILTLALFWLMRELEVGRRVAFWVTIMVVVSPAVILYENYAFYTYPVTVGLVVMALFLKRYLDDYRLVNGLVFFSLMAAIALTRSLFHLLWVFGVVAGVWTVSHGYRLRTLRAAAVPVFLVTAVYVKNLVIFGFFGVSSWFGMSLAIVTVFPLDQAARSELFEQGKLSQYAYYSPFKRPEVYGLGFGSTGVAALDRPTKPGGHVNFNHIGYIDVSRQYMEDAISALVERPDGAARGVLAATGFYFRPANEYYYVRNNRDQIRAFDAAYGSFFYGRPIYRDEYDRPESGRPIGWYVRGLGRVSPTIVVLYLAAFLVGVVTLIRGVRTRRFSASGSTLIFAVGTIVWITVFGVSLEVRENNRFRFPSEPLVAASVAAGVSRWIRSRDTTPGDNPLNPINADPDETHPSTAA